MLRHTITVFCQKWQEQIENNKVSGQLENSRYTEIKEDNADFITEPVFP